MLHIDMTGNLVYCLPQFCYSPATPDGLQVFTQSEFTYHVVPIHLFHDGTAVFQRVARRPEPEEHKKMLPADPSSSPITVSSHINPFFVVANAGAKILSDTRKCWESPPMAVNIWKELPTLTDSEPLQQQLATDFDLGECPEGHYIATAGNKLIVNRSNHIIRRSGRYQGMPGGP
ncbi:hypothetical protein C8J57DRAFT_1232359 [Mycena rebaudengoi]|nr:hypothetical protein C8J57DRAFT_1232359 [Mycena rebaudengoi]